MSRDRKTRIIRRKDSKKKLIIKISKIIRNIILLIIVFLISYMVCGMYQEAKVRTVEEGKSTGTTQNLNDNLNDEELENSTKKFPIIPVAEKFKGYKVDSRLEIPKIALKTNVLTEYTEEGLDICASKYYGPKANEIGNYCIAGHNYNKENMFNHLIELEIGDSIFLSDNQNGIIEYYIYDIYKVKPYNVEPLSQATNDKREITLITCVNYSKNRLIIKAVEKSS